MHKPVLLNEVIMYASEIEPLLILDGTFGRGGHTRALLARNTRAQVDAFDQDSEAIAFGRETFADEIAAGRLRLHHRSFHDLGSGEYEGQFNVILLDLGVSSPQLDRAERGFSFYHDGPLDMRMNQSAELTAADVVNTWSQVELIDLFRSYGEIRRPDRVVRALVNDRAEQPFTTTRALAGLIERVEGWRRKGHHPATEYFLALRMAVNNELTGLESSLPRLMRALKPGGRLIVITFHSLEDRIIKYAFKETTELGRPLFKKVITPTREEVLENPRSRSAKLRVFERGPASHESTTSERDPTIS